MYFFALTTLSLNFFFEMLLLILFLFVLFKNFIHIKRENIIDIRKFLILFFIGILLVWFFKHPSLRYGGYFPLSLMFIVILLTVVQFKYVERKVEY